MENSTLRRANVARQQEWDTGDKIDLSFSGNELAGEVGELAQAVVDYEHGSENMIAVREEIGDVVICCDLIAMRLDRPLSITDRPTEKPAAWEYPTEYMLVDLGIELGNVSNTIKKRERGRLGIVGAAGSIDDLMVNLSEMLRIVHMIADRFGQDAVECAAEKFNKTSVKYGLATMMSA